MTDYPYYVNEKCYCILCEMYFNEFKEWQKNEGTDFVRNFDLIGSDPRYFQCPVCGSTDRERHLYLYLKETGELDKFENKLILYVKKIAKPSMNFICGDIEPEKYLHLNINPFYKIDLTHIIFENDTFDYVIANHILEHIPDYQKALKEIFRVLKPNGTAILQTPFA
ncbi:MAG: class I SAM-dependent methyltransferase, partial [Ignavibacteria bacterium]|nr:class I SAM-dependent methyltransferase [Ignavibacteria bacterium]